MSSLRCKETLSGCQRLTLALPLNVRYVLDVSVGKGYKYPNARRQQPQLYRSTTGGHVWQHLTAPGADDDMVVAMDWDPSHPQRVYAGTDRGAIFCSQDRGVSWEPLPITLPTIAVGALVVGLV